jgi:hypothetical protein
VQSIAGLSVGADRHRQQVRGVAVLPGEVGDVAEVVSLAVASSRTINVVPIACVSLSGRGAALARRRVHRRVAPPALRPLRLPVPAGNASSRRTCRRR